MSLNSIISELASDENININDSDIKHITKFINKICDYLAKRSYHLMTHCNRKTMMLRDIKNATRIEIVEDLSNNLLKYCNRLVTKYFIIKKGYSLEILNELFNYELLCPSKILLEIGIKFPMLYFRDKLKLINTYQVRNETTIFLATLCQFLTVEIIKKKKLSNMTITKIISEYELFSDEFVN